MTENTAINRRHLLRVLVSGAGSAVLVACSQEKSPPASKGAAPAKAKATSAPAAAAKPSGEKVAVKIGVGDQLVYSTKKIEVAAGSTVELTISHAGKMDKSVMGHNFVLLKQGTDMNKFASAAMTAMGTGYIPEAMKDQVIAHTKVVGGGESDTITFAAPAAGEYTYLCSFPGHAAAMNGKFIVT